MTLVLDRESFWDEVWCGTNEGAEAGLAGCGRPGVQTGVGRRVVQAVGPGQHHQHERPAQPVELPHDGHLQWSRHDILKTL